MQLTVETTYTFYLPTESEYAEEFEKYHNMDAWYKTINEPWIIYTNRCNSWADAQSWLNTCKTLRGEKGK